LTGLSVGSEVLVAALIKIHVVWGVAYASW